MNSGQVVIIGGGAGGFFAAISAKQHNPALHVTILERGNALLSKVRISGGGRCNVTHNQPDPALLIHNYPRGMRALRGPFTRFGPAQTIEWFAGRGVKLKAEADGRMFPVTDNSQTIIDCLVEAATELGVDIRTRTAVTGVDAADGGGFTVQLRDGSSLDADNVVIATGSAPASYKWAADLGHTIEAPVPSLFTFNIDDARLRDLAGISVPLGQVRLDGARDTHEGPLLITHWGLSGPAVLRSSAWNARLLFEHDYNLGVTVNWLPALNQNESIEQLRAYKDAHPKRLVQGSGPFDLPQRLWRSLASAAGAAEDLRWADAPRKLLNQLAVEVNAGRYQVTGKGVFKEEFVTCGGINLKEVDFTTMESRIQPGLHFVGEVLDIDGITGGFNFQAAWTTGWHAGRAIAAG